MLANRGAESVGKEVLGVYICEVLVEGKMLGRALGQGDVGTVLEGVVGCVELLGHSDVEETGRGVEVDLADHNAEHHLAARTQSHRQGRGVDLSGNNRGGVDNLFPEGPKSEVEEEGGEEYDDGEGEQAPGGSAVVGFHVVPEHAGVGEEVGVVEQSVEVGPTRRHSFYLRSNQSL